MSDFEDDEFLQELRDEINKDKESLLNEEPAEKPIQEQRAKQKESLGISSSNIDVDERSGIRLKRRLVSAVSCDRALKNVEFVPVKKIGEHTSLINSIYVGVKPSSHWFTIGVIDKYSPKEDFCVVRISDMHGMYIYLYITGKAYTKHQNAIGMGSVITIKRPFMLKPTEVHSSIALHVTKLDQFWVIGQSLDLVQCSNYIRKDKRCEEWADIRSGDFCDYHLQRIYNYSKNSRMELASGDAGFDIRWATEARNRNGLNIYEAHNKEKKAINPLQKLLGQRSKLKEAYFIPGKGLVAVDGSLIVRKAENKRTSEAEKAEAEEFLKGRRDPGSEMLKKLMGIKDEAPKMALSKEAMDKLGIGSKSLTQEEEEAKKRSIDALNDASKTKETSSKKPRFIEL